MSTPRITLIVLSLLYCGYSAPWRMDVQDSTCLFNCSIPSNRNADSLLEHLWDPQILKKMTGKIAKVEISSPCQDSQVVTYSFKFLGHTSIATYSRKKESPRHIYVVQMSFSTNWTIFPRPLSSTAVYSIDSTSTGCFFNYMQHVVFDKSLTVWDIFIGKLMLAATVSDFEKLMKDF